MDLIRCLLHSLVLLKVDSENDANVMQNQTRTNQIRHISQMHIHPLQENPPSTFEHSDCALNAHAY
jgi:hypothetical protein